MALVAAALIAVVSAPAFAVLPSEMLKDPALEARARTLSEQLRCLVCQNQSIDDSEAPLAADIRVLLRERLKAGDSDQQALDFLVARYGDFILLKPPFNPATALLWLAPALALAAGAAFVVVSYRRRRFATAEPALDAGEEERLRQLLSGKP